MFFGELKIGDLFLVRDREFQKITAYHAVPTDQPVDRHVFHQTEDVIRTGAKGLLIDYQGTVAADKL